jgi:RNA polymerase sigma-B factor
MEGKENNSKVIHSDYNNKEIFYQYMESPNIDTRNEIVSRYLYLAEFASKKFLNRGVEYDDIYQVASLALIKAVERFNPDRGVKFITFAMPTIVGEIKRYFRDKGSTIRIPRRVYESYQKVNHAREYLFHELQRAPRVPEIAFYLNISEENVLEIMESWNVYNMNSFDQNVFDDSDLEMHETIGWEEGDFERIENRDFLNKSLDRFNETEKLFIKQRYFENKTQREIAEKLGVSQMYVSRLEKKVINRFKKILNK